MKFTEFGDISVGLVPQDFSVAARVGKWINVTERQKLIVAFAKASGVYTAETPTITLEQATDNVGTSSKVLNFNKIYTKESADLWNTSFTEVTQPVPSGSYTDTVGVKQSLWMIDVDGNQLDTTNSFNHVRASFLDSGSGVQYGALLYIKLNNNDLIANPNHISVQNLVSEFSDVVSDNNIYDQQNFSYMAGPNNVVNGPNHSVTVKST